MESFGTKTVGTLHRRLDLFLMLDVFFFKVYLGTNSHFAPETRPFALPPKKEKACLPFSQVFTAKPAVCFKESISTYGDILMIM